MTPLGAVAKLAKAPVSKTGDSRFESWLPRSLCWRGHRRDDHALFRAGVTSLLLAAGHEVVGEAGDGIEALERTRELHPDLVLMDIAMPRCGGLEATRLIKAEMPETKIVIVTVSQDDADLFEAVKSGAEGYLLKDMSNEEFERTLQGIAEGEAPLSQGLAAKILEEFGRVSRGDGSQGTDRDALTDREQEVLRLVTDGKLNREIAEELFIAESTVNFHMKNILSKLHLRNRAEAVAYALRSGLVEVTSPDP
jgi:DNA-binding NarL/FixJ family response regulator